MKLVTGYEFLMVSHLLLSDPTSKVSFFSKISNPCLRNQFGFYRKKSGHTQIVLRCPKS